MISVIIPAHNEANVIGRCLEPLLDGLEGGHLEIIVVCNGCEDRTAEVAQSTHGGIIVLESPVPSKIAALNEGDRHATGYPRVYLDADIVTDTRAIEAVAGALERGECLAAAPRMRIALGNRNPLVKAYYRLWSEVPYFREGMIGCGFYALGREGRSRFGEFPKVTADDEFVRRLFAKSERKTVEDAYFVMTPPKTLTNIIKINTRAIFGNIELGQMNLEGVRDEGKDFGPFARKVALTPELWFPLIVYSTVRLLTIIAARKRARASSGARVWDRDDSSRE